MKSKTSLHEIRRANNKIKLLNVTLDHLKYTKFDEININSVCEDAEISKVTYYNYFQNKGDILLYYMSIWCYKLELVIHEKSLHGINAIKQVFDNIVSLENNQEIIIGLIGFIANLKEKPTRNKLSYIEKTKLFPQKEESLYNITEKTIDEIFLKHINEAIRSNEIKEKNNNLLVSQLLTIFYGSPFSLYTQNKSDLKELYNVFLSDILK